MRKWLLSVCVVGVFSSVGSGQVITDFTGTADTKLAAAGSTYTSPMKTKLDNLYTTVSLFNAKMTTIDNHCSHIRTESEAMRLEIDGLKAAIARLMFFAEVSAVVICIIWGGLTWKLYIYGKNQRDIW